MHPLLTTFALCWLVTAPALSAAPPEIWVQQLEDRIPNTTPDGRTNSSICYALRMAGGDAKTNILALYLALRFNVRDKANRVLEDNWFANGSRFIAGEDIIGLNRPYTQQVCNLIYLEGETLIIPDGTGGGHHFEGIKEGTYYIEVVWDTTKPYPYRGVPELEKEYIGDSDPFFRGAILCGTLTLHVGKAQHPAKKKR